ncbi:hypothetical protein R3W88_002484 [Solanum pinnatisectum]|uniref:Uncharacterized protein n=1 Tax=Solanum pinnatisectum TaxID=50273 RepID=A0AAV9MLC6_9SOLN|nr:hypothetical protein R3W88_002484 [Solanum pinnatisectum]
MRMTSGDTDDRGWTPLHIIARKSDLKHVRRLLNEGMDANVMSGGPSSFGMTLLHLAAKGGHVRVMDELLERGADIDARAKGACAWTPLHHVHKEKRKKRLNSLLASL